MEHLKRAIEKLAQEKENDRQHPTPGKKDQYGKPIPTDLVVIPDIEDLSEESIDLIDNVDWYETKDGYAVILVSAKAINYISEIDPSDAGIDITTSEFELIDPALHRYSIEDGFYHA